LALIVVALGLVVLYAPTVAWLFGRWTMTVWHHAHGLLIPPAVAYFAWLELKRVRRLPVSASAWGFALLLPALALHVIDTGLHSQILSAASIVVALPGLALLFLGTARSKAIAFPLAFLAFMLPIPLAVTERLHLALRHIATEGTAAVLPWLGMTVFSEGTTLHLTRTTLIVADACSGFSTLYASCAVAALTAYTAERWRDRVIVLLAAVPIAIVANIIRVVLLAVLTEWRGAEILETWVHVASGMLTFALALPVIFWLGSTRTPRTAS
jgi:exosortase